MGEEEGDGKKRMNIKKINYFCYIYLGIRPTFVLMAIWKKYFQLISQNKSEYKSIRASDSKNYRALKYKSELCL